MSKKVRDIIKSNIKQEMKDKNIKVAKLCKDFGVDRNYINHISNQVQLIKLIDIAVYIGCGIEDIVIGSDQ